MAKVYCESPFQGAFRVNETADEIDRLVLHAGRPTGFILLHMKQCGTPFRQNIAYITHYHDKD